MKIKICRGTTRDVLLVGSLAFKLPSIYGYKEFLGGLLANMQEKRFSKLDWEELCPVWFTLPGGLLVVMPKADPHQLSRAELCNFVKKHKQKTGFDLPVESKLSSFGIYNGKLVAIDYGS